MKNLFPIAVIAMFVALSATSVTSCKKSDSDPTGNYNCVCTSTSGSVTTIDTLPITNQKKSVATSACNQFGTASGTGFSCTLK